MAFNLPIYKVVLSDDKDEIDFNSIVDYPAHSKAFHLFDGEQKRIHEEFNDEKMIVTGVAVATDVPIFRRDKMGREYYLYFTEAETKKFAERLFDRGYMNNVNEMHDSNKGVSGMKIIESYFIDNAGINGPKPPQAFEGQNLKNGTWIVSYQVTDPKMWAKLKSGVYAGFSVEGWFTLERMKFKNQNRMKNENKGFFERIKNKLAGQSQNEVFGSAETTDGATIVWDGEDLEVGNELRLAPTEEGGDEILAPEGIHTVMNENGESLVITVDANGIVSELEIVEAEEEVDEMEQAVEEMAATIAKLKAENEAKDTEFATFKEETNKKIESFEKFLNENHKPSNKQKTEAPTWKDFTKNK